MRLGEIEGVFTLPDPLPAKMLFISAGSGITPIISMLRSLDHRDEVGDVVVIHSARTREQVMFLSDPRRPRRAATTGCGWTCGSPPSAGDCRPKDLDEVCPDWREREAFCSGPGEMLDALIEHWEDERRSAIGCTSSGSSRRSAATPAPAKAARSRFLDSDEDRRM